MEPPFKKHRAMIKKSLENQRVKPKVKARVKPNVKIPDKLPDAARRAQIYESSPVLPPKKSPSGPKPLMKDK